MKGIYIREILTEEEVRECFQNPDLPFELEILTIDRKDALQKLRAEDIQFALFEGDQTVPLSHEYQSLHLHIRQSHCSDLVLKLKDNKHTPLIPVTERDLKHEQIVMKAMGFLITENEHKFRVEDQLLILGSYPISQCAVSQMLNYGYRRIGVVLEEGSVQQEVANRLSSLLLKSELTFYKFNQLPLLPGIFGVVINALPRDMTTRHFEEICFLNYLRAQGLFLNASGRWEEELTQEVIKVGSRCISGEQIYKKRNQLFLEQYDSLAKEGV